jgi:uncharacterized membrane protein YdjX (TVP38/TMEM64 family)
MSKFYAKYSRLIHFILILAILWALLAWIGSYYRPFSPEVLLSKEGADNVKVYILSWGQFAPVFFIAIQVLQVVIAPIPGQAAGFLGGYVFGWKLGAAYTMIGLTIGTFLVLALTRRFGRAFVERFNAVEALKDFEGLFRSGSAAGPPEGAYSKSKRALSSHPLLTFFIIMLLPGLPDDLVCFVAGLSGVPVWQLLLAAVLGRLPGMLVLSMAGAGFSEAQTNRVFIAMAGAFVLFGVLYLWKQRQIEGFLRRVAGVQ